MYNSCLLALIFVSYATAISTLTSIDSLPTFIATHFNFEDSKPLLVVASGSDDTTKLVAALETVESYEDSYVVLVSGDIAAVTKLLTDKPWTQHNENEVFLIRKPNKHAKLTHKILSANNTDFVHFLLPSIEDVAVQRLLLPVDFCTNDAEVRERKAHYEERSDESAIKFHSSLRFPFLSFETLRLTHSPLSSLHRLSPK